MASIFNFKSLLIDPNSDDFRWWLQWLIDEKKWNANEIIGAMYESHKYQDLQKEYLNEEQEKEK